MSTDIVFQIQEALDRLSAGLYSTIGALQRDAQPASVRGEPATSSSSQSKAEGISSTGKGKEMSSHWATEIMALSKIVDDLVDSLPDVTSTEKEELDRIADAMTVNEEAGDKLRQETAATRELLTEIRSMYAVLADAELSRRHGSISRQTDK